MHTIIHNLCIKRFEPVPTSTRGGSGRAARYMITEPEEVINKHWGSCPQAPLYLGKRYGTRGISSSSRVDNLWAGIPNAVECANNLCVDNGDRRAVAPLARFICPQRRGIVENALSNARKGWQGEVHKLVCLTSRGDSGIIRVCLCSQLGGVPVEAHVPAP